MVSHLFFYQLTLIALVWLCVSVLPTSPRETRFSIAYSHPYMNPMTWRLS